MWVDNRIYSIFVIGDCDRYLGWSRYHCVVAVRQTYLQGTASKC